MCIRDRCQKVYNEECLLIDKEDSYTTEYGKLLGVNNNMLTIISPHTQEDMYDVILKALESNLFGVIVVDSVTAFAPSARFEGSVVMGVDCLLYTSDAADERSSVDLGG